MRFPAGLAALNHRDFRVFWSGQLVSQLGTWMQRVGQAWRVLELTNSPLKLGIITALQFSPVLVFSVLAGAVVDRVVKRRLLVLTQTVLMPQAAILTVLVWTGVVRYWHVAVLATVYGLANAFDMPTRQSFVADLVGVIGFAQIVFQATCNTMLQITAPDGLRGRVMSLYAFTFAGITPFGSLLVGSIAETLGASAACALAGAAGLLSVAIFTALWRPQKLPAGSAAIT